MTRPFDIYIEDSNGVLEGFVLARGQSGQPLFQSSTRETIKPTVQVGDATYASFDPRTQGVFAQADLSGGIGKRAQVPSQESDFKRVRYGEWVDFGAYGISKGPKVSTVAKLSNMGPLSGAFELGGYCYLIAGRIVAKYDHAAGTISQAYDLGAGSAGYDGAAWLQLGAEAKDQENTGDAATDTITSASGRIAQSFVPGSTGYLSRVDVKLIKASSPTGTVDLALQLDRNGQPDGVDIVSSGKLATDISTSATVYTYRFEEGDVLLEKGVTYWLVLSAAGTSGANTVGWRRDNTNPGGYASGTGAVSADGGASYTANANSTDYYFATYMRPMAATAFVGRGQGEKLITTADGSAFAADGEHEGKHLAVFADMLVRDCRAASSGAISTTLDGVNWLEPIALGDTSVPVTKILALPSCLVVVKEDSIWVVDPDPSDISAQCLHAGPRNSANGAGACVWRGVAYIPFGGQLVAVQGDFDAGFTRHLGIGPDSADEWESPWGAGRVVAVAGDQQCLYAAMSTETSYRLFKSYSPLERRWVGAIADLGTPSALSFMYVFDRGGTNSPLLFFSTDSDDLGVIRCARTRNPFADSAYQVDTANTGRLFFPQATSNMPASPKSWLYETFTFQRTAPGGYVEMLYDDGEFFPPVDIPMTDSLAGWAIQHRHSLLIGNLPVEIKKLNFKTNHAIGKPKKSQSWMGSPIATRDKVIGYVGVASYRLNAFDQSDVELIENIAQQAAIAIDNSFHHAEVEEQSHLDSLSGAFNHGYFLTRLGEEADKARKEKTPLSLIMLDIDHFKQYNDRYGHLAGDQILFLLTQTIRSHIHSTDLVGRWGGEEFAIALPNTNRAQAFQVAERIRQSMNTLVITGRNEKEIPSPTVSQGIAYYPDETSEIFELIDLADQRLYAAKERGRNQIGQASEPLVAQPNEQGDPPFSTPADG